LNFNAEIKVLLRSLSKPKLLERDLNIIYKENQIDFGCHKNFTSIP